MKFSLMFFSSEIKGQTDIYQFVLDVAKYADENEFESLWVPERHFAEFGGAFTNPPLTLSAIAACTNQLGLRAGSFISPLHNTIRAAENWSFLDNLSRGRVGISFGSGWNVNDFVFAPEVYEKRHSHMYSQMEEIRKLWRGGTIRFKNSYDKDFEVALHPMPFQNELPIWTTTSGNIETYKSAAKYNTNVLTHMINQDIDTLKDNIKIYKQELVENGFDPDQREITLMLHTYIDDDPNKIFEVTAKPFKQYLKSAVNLENQAAKGGGTISGGLKGKHHEIPSDLLEELLDITYERYCQTASLIGTQSKCHEMLEKLSLIGVTEVASLIDFGLSGESIMSGLAHLNELKNNYKGV